MDPNGRPAVYGSLFHELVALVALTAAPAMNSMSLGGIQMGLPEVGKSLGMKETELTWLLAAYALMSGSFLLLFGAIADSYGRKKVLLISFIWMALWCLVSGFMENYIVFCVMRGLQGLAGAAAVPASVGILGATYKKGVRKNKIFSVYGAGQPLGFVVGIIAGGVATEKMNWRANMWWLAIFYAVFTPIAYFSIPGDAPVSEENKALRKKIDIVGAVMVTAGFLIFVFGLTQSESASKKWATPYVIVCIVLGVLLVISFVCWEAYVENPLMPLKIWRYPQFAQMMLIIAVAQIAFPCVLQFYTVLWFQKIRDATPLETTLYFVPMAVGGVAVNAFAGKTMHKIRGTILLTVGMISFTGASLLWALQPMYFSYWKMAFPSLLLSVIGADLLYMVANLFVVHSAPESLQSTAGGVFNTVIQLSTSLALGANSALASGVTGDDHSKEGLLRGYRACYWFAVAATALGVVLAALMKIGVEADLPTVTDEEQASTTSSSTPTVNDYNDKRPSAISDSSSSSGDLNSEKV